MNAELCEQDMNYEFWMSKSKTTQNLTIQTIQDNNSLAISNIKPTSNVKSIFHVELTNQTLQSDTNEEIAESSSQLQDSANEDINASNEIVNLCVGYVFESWEDIDMIIKTYGKREGFGVVQKRLKLHPEDHIKHQQIVLWLEYYDVILNDNTAKTNHYQMSLSLFFIVNNNTRSRLVAQALMSDETTESYKWILECTKKITMIELLVFITNADSAADAAVRQTYQNTYSVYCIFHISENLPKNLKSKLHSQYESFVHDFFLCRNSLCKENFYERWSQLTEKYSNVKDYLMRALYPNLNSIVKHLLTTSSSLCDLVDVLDARLQDETQWNQFFEYQTMLSCMGIVSVDHDLFPEIDKKMSKYLIPHILSAECLEMSQCLYFVTSQIDIVNNNDEDFNLIVMDEFIEDLYDTKQILLKSIIAEVGEENVREVMMYSKVAGFHIQMIPVRWYNDEQKDKDIIMSACCFANQESAKNQLNEILMPNPSTISKSMTEMMAWLKEFIGWHKKTVATLTGSVRNWNLQEPFKIQANDENKENEPGSIENSLVSR
ncbi:5369_t:CDS:2 [Ambispora gerdemannii]|uniref:5369_t:CDS:1 n=1 Tax=Ambispora gerdemannii TaxID=144530 RepID=A0A9N9B4V1_9GLOM|nr:5369_t:CDS:2 [Ambispora gerdemannii]